MPRSPERKRLTRRSEEELAQLREKNTAQFQEFMEQLSPTFSRLGIASEHIAEQVNLGNVIVSGITVQQRSELKKAVEELGGTSCDDFGMEHITGQPEPSPEQIVPGETEPGANQDIANNKDVFDWDRPTE